MPPEQVRPAVWVGIARAEGYGIRVERDLILYLELLVRLGADFDLRPEHAWARSLLRSPALLPATRVRMVYDRLVEGTPDADGRARIDGLRAAGECVVTFPDLDEDAWGPTSAR